MFLYKILDKDKYRDKNIIRIGVDFDNTIIEKCTYPEVNYILKPNIKEVLYRLKNKYNIEFILFTARTGWYRYIAIKYIKKNNLPIICSILNKKPRCNYYIDDLDIYCNKIDWLEIENILENKLNYKGK